MQHLIAEYLFFNQRCTLPDLGELRLQQRHAAYAQGDQMMHAPVAEIHLMESNVFDDGLVKFISRATQIPENNAQAQLHQFCSNIKIAGKETVIPSLGTFSVDEDGEISFIGVETDTTLWAPVTATRVVRKDTHQILVGDTESDSEQMTAYYADQAVSKRTWWWAWAIGLFLLATVAITYYIIEGRHHQGFGSMQSIPEVPTPKTYDASP